MNRTTNHDARQPAEREPRRGARGERTRGEEQDRSIDLTRLREVGRNLSTQLGQQARKRPYVVAGVAAGIGFVAGSIFGSRIGQMMLVASIGYFAKNLLAGNIGIERLQENLEKLAHERTNA
jgi:hypothetical protein